MAQMQFGQICCCNVGAVIPRWQNTTRVRKTNGCDDLSTINTVVPYGRDISGDNVNCGASSLLPKTPADWKGSWLVGGDLNGLSAQEVEDTVDDIMACAGDDATHAKNDHNCYLKNGDTVDMRATKLFGGQWILAKKNWHGQFPFNVSDGCAANPNDDPCQTKYLTRSVTMALLENSSDDGYYASNDVNWTLDGSASIGRYTGIKTNDCSHTCDDVTDSFVPPIRAEFFSDMNAACCLLQDSPTVANWLTVCDPGTVITTAGGSSGTQTGDLGIITSVSSTRTATTYSWEIKKYNFFTTPGGPYLVFHYTGTITLSNPYTAADCYEDFKAALAAWDMSDLNLAAMRTDENLALAPLCLFDEVRPTSPKIHTANTMDDYSATQNSDGSWPQRAWIDQDNYIWKYPNGSYDRPSGFTGGATLLTPMRTGAIIAHTRAGSDRHFWFNYAKQQRELQPEPYNYYEWFADTRGGFSESPLPPVTMRWMDNEEAQYDGAAFRNGADPHPGNYPQAFWTQRGGVIRGAKFVQASERWPAVNFGRPCGADKYAVDQPTVCCITGGDATSGFTVKKTGNAIAPLASGGLVVNDYIVVESDGIYKISGITDNGTSDWDGTGDPYQRFTVTVGSKLDDLPTGYEFRDPEQSGDGAPTTTPTPPTGVLSSSTSGLDTTFTVAVTDNGNTILGVTITNTFGTTPVVQDFFVSALPYSVTMKTALVGSVSFSIRYTSGITYSPGTHCGRMRFPTASGICGRAAITTAYTSGTVTITPAAAQPWLRTDPTTGTILVDVYDASMTLVASALSLTRVSDTSFTVVHAALATAVWMTGHGVNWTHYDATPKKTGVHLEWSFNQRKAATGYTGTVPTWYGGIGGCLACSVTQFTYSSGVCPAAIGIVPFYSPLPVEQFANQKMFDFPATVIFDDVYGAQWQAAVMLTMPDPFWQQPFKPDCFIVAPDSLRWHQDDGTGQADTEETTEGGATVYHRFYAHHPLVEALSTIPAGMTLPAGVSLLYDPSVNVIAPPYYNQGTFGIPIGDSAGNYASLEMDWGFTLRVCGNVGGRFRTEYNFVKC